MDVHPILDEWLEQWVWPMPIMSNAGDTMRALRPRMSPLYPAGSRLRPAGRQAMRPIDYTAFEVILSCHDDAMPLADDGWKDGNVMVEHAPHLIADELTFLTQHMDQSEASILVQALQVGLNVLYRQTVERLFIDGDMTRQEAVHILGEGRIAELEYAQQALAQDVAQGFHLR